MRHKYTPFLFIALLLVVSACRQKQVESTSPPAHSDLKDIIALDTLRVATMYGPVSYFQYRDENMGYDYEMAIDLAKYLKVNLKIIVAKNETEMAGMLAENKVDLVACNVVETKQFKNIFDYVFAQPETFQVLVQNMGRNTVNDVTELSGKKVHVTANSIYSKRLKALNDELGGLVEIVTHDTLTNDELISMVATKKIDYTVSHHNVAMLHKSLYKNLDCRMPVGFDQRNGWLVSRQSPELKKAIDEWAALPETNTTKSGLYFKYWMKSPYITMLKVKIPRGAISPFDPIFRKYSALINWDWRLLAALAFHESRFDSSQVSWAGARGIMQLMPRTAANFGLDSESILVPERNIEAGVQYIKSLNLAFRKIEDEEERIKFVLAAYNSGPAHIFDAMALADKYGKNPHIWYDQVEYYLIKKSEPEYYNDPLVKFGNFGAKETVRFVQNVLGTYEKYLNKNKQ